MQHLEFKASFTAGDAGQIAGYASLFGRPADFAQDIVAFGAFAESLTRRTPEMKSEHAGPAIGAWDEVVEDEMGLRVKGRLNLDTPAGRAVYADVIAGRKGGLSIGYVATKSAKDASGARVLAQVDLHEISIVRNPASSRTRILSVKNMEGSMPENEDTSPDLAALEGKLSDLDKAVKALPVVEVKSFVDRLDKIEAKMNRPAAKENPAEPTLERKSFTSYLRLGNAAPVEEIKSLTVSSDPQGGYLAPAEMSTEFVRDLVQFSPIRAVASVRTTGAPSVIYPKRTGITNAKWKGEGQTSEASEPAFGQLEIPVKEMNTYVDISNQLLADSAGQAEAEVRLALAEDFGQKEALAFVSGNGVLEPTGLLTDASIGYTANGHATTLSADALISFMYALPAAYRNAGSWLLNGTTLAVIRKLRDGQNNYLWQPSFQAGQPETILGRPVVEAVDMPDIAADAFPIMFGDLATGYRIVDRVSLSILVNPYVLATTGMTRIHATRRVGGGVIQPNALRKLKMAVS